MTLPQNITTAELMALDYRYNYSDEELQEDWRRLCTTTTYKTGAQFKPGMKLCQHFCPNFWDIQSENGQSFAKAWQDPQIMDRVRQWGLEGMSQLWLSWVRRAVYMAAGLPNSSFYRPHFSKQIIEMSGKLRGTLFDPCAGWGGRMLGTVASGWDYYSCEPNVETWNNLQRMLSFIRPQSVVDIACIPVELYSIESIRPDVVLTSPPYFNLEVYASDSGQSYVTHNNYEAWRDNWLLPLIRRCLSVLPQDGISAWNVMNFKRYALVEDVVEEHRKHGWILTATVGFQSPLANIRATKNKDVTYVFRRA